ISAITQINRRQYNFEKIYTSSDWHDRLIQGSDYPLPGVMPIFSLSDFVNKSYLSQAHADVLSQVRKYNPLLFDFMLKRIIRVNNKALSHKVFEGNRVFG
ncbi:MAG: amidohydrolase, partial [Gammaproteobacteria bacterium]|nr:amidohydrolase [Gammaproteobacteria bacterium]